MNFSDKNLDYSFWRFLVDKSYKNNILQALKGQLGVIIFSSDMLGGATGLVSNVTEGVVGLICDPGVKSVGGLVKTVTHGLSNSTAKMTGTLNPNLTFVRD